MIHGIFAIIPVLIITSWLIFFNIKKNESKVKRYISFILAVSLVGFLILWYYLNNYLNVVNVLDAIWVFTSLSVYPLYYYYIRLMTVDIKIDYRWLWLFTPAIILALFTAVIYSMMTPQEIEVFTNNLLYKNNPVSGSYSTLIKLQSFRIMLFELTLVIEVLLTTVFGMQHIIRSNKNVFAFYSKIKNRKILDISIPFLFLMTSAIVAMTSNIIGKGFFVNTPYLLALPFIAHPMAFCITCCDRFKKTIPVKVTSLKLAHSLVGEKLQEGEEEGEEEIEVGIFALDNNHDEFYEKMEDLLKNKQIFKNSELRLNDLALRLGTNRTYLSQLINNKTNSNFNDYINSYRIAYAKELLSMENEDQLPLDEIAIMSGFSSQSSFYRVFKKIEETSPSKYRVSQMEKVN